MNAWRQPAAITIISAMIAFAIGGAVCGALLEDDGLKGAVSGFILGGIVGGFFGFIVAIGFVADESDRALSAVEYKERREDFLNEAAEQVRRNVESNPDRPPLDKKALLMAADCIRNLKSVDEESWHRGTEQLVNMARALIAESGKRERREDPELRRRMVETDDYYFAPAPGAAS